MEKEEKRWGKEENEGIFKFRVRLLREMRYLILSIELNRYMVIVYIISFRKCSKIHISLAFCPFFTALEASRCRFGNGTVPIPSFSFKWTHQTAHRSGYSIVCSLNYGSQRHVRLCHLPSKFKGNFGDQVAIFGYDH